MTRPRKYIDFPIEEHDSLSKRIKNNQIIYTTRVSDEVNKYFIDSIYDSPFGKLKVVYFKHFTNINDHPFLSELNKAQIAEISKHINKNGFDLIGLAKV